MLRYAKMGLLHLAERSGVSRLLSQSAWRRQRLLILCYHGVSTYDEHEWGHLYISQAVLRRHDRAQARCNVLRLSKKR